MLIFLQRTLFGAISGAGSRVRYKTSSHVPLNRHRSFFVPLLLPLNARHAPHLRISGMPPRRRDKGSV
jgi:hypothetical protein